MLRFLFPSQFSSLEALLAEPFPHPPEDLWQLEQRLSTTAAQGADQMMLVQLTRAHEDECFVRQAIAQGRARSPVPLMHKGGRTTRVRRLGGTCIVLETPSLREDRRGRRGRRRHKRGPHGVAKMVEEQPDFPFVVVSPHCPPHQAWSTDALAARLDAIESRSAIDPERLSVTGLSMGGFGTWAVAMTHPDRCAAIVPVCGGGDPVRVGAMRHVPVWAFHGAHGAIVPLQRSVEMVTALRQCGGNVRFTVYPRCRPRCVDRDVCHPGTVCLVAVAHPSATSLAHR